MSSLAESAIRRFNSHSSVLSAFTSGKSASSLYTLDASHASWDTRVAAFARQASASVVNANPVNVFLGAIALYFLSTLLLPSSVAKLTPTLTRARSATCHAGNSYSFLPDEHPPTAVWRRYTPRTLAVHDGSGLSSGKNAGEGGKILLAIEGRVFDVTKGANFYGPGGPYGNFAGRDASRGMAKQSFDLEMLTPLDKPLDKLDDLTPMEVNNMREWVSHFSSKYTVVGELVNERDEAESKSG